MLDYYDIDLNNENDTQLFVRDQIAPVVETIKFKRHFNAGDEYIEMRVKVSDNAGIKLVQPILTDPIPVNNEWADNPATSLGDGWYVKNFDVGCKGYVRSIIVFSDMTVFVFVKDINSNWNLSETHQQTLIGEWFEAALEWAVAAKEAVEEAAAAVAGAINFIKSFLEGMVNELFNNHLKPFFETIKDAKAKHAQDFNNIMEKAEESMIETGRVALEVQEQMGKILFGVIFTGLIAVSAVIVVCANMLYYASVPLAFPIIMLLVAMMVSFLAFALFEINEDWGFLKIDYSNPGVGDELLIGIESLYLSETEDNETQVQTNFSILGALLSTSSVMFSGLAAAFKFFVISSADVSGNIPATLSIVYGLFSVIWSFILLDGIGAEYEGMAKIWSYVCGILSIVFGTIAIMRFNPPARGLAFIALMFGVASVTVLLGSDMY